VSGAFAECWASLLTLTQAGGKITAENWTSLLKENTAMSGPIVRTGTTPKFWANYDNIFGDKKATGEKNSTDKSKKTKKSVAKAKKK
jgi:hypothetical protein